jgi:branched-chain amino acid transport system substrate-binding protein
MSKALCLRAIALGVGAITLLGLTASGNAAGKYPLGKAEIVVGATAAQTGLFSLDGAHFKRAFELWADQVNAKGGILGSKVKLIVYDDQSKGTTAASLYERLITVDKADVLLGNCCGPLTAATVPIAEKYNVLMVQGGNCGDNVYEGGFKFQIGTMPGLATTHAEKLFDWADSLPESQRPKKVAIIHNPLSFAFYAGQGALKMAKERGYDVVFYEQYDIKTPDYAPLMTKIKATNPDMLIVGAWAKEGILQVRAMKEIDFNPKVFFHAGAPPTPAFFKALGKDSNYAMWTSHWGPEYNTPGTDEFVEAYTKKFGFPPYDWIASAYDSGRALEQAIVATKSLDGKTLRKWAAKSKGIQLLGGKLAWDKTGAPNTVYALSQLYEGKAIVVYPASMGQRPGVKPFYPRPKWSNIDTQWKDLPKLGG